MAAFVATPEWERFTGTAQGSSEVWASAHEGGTDPINSALANNNLTSLTIHLNCREPSLVTIEPYSLPIDESL
jgi:hypothetical protein